MSICLFFFFNDTATTEIYTLSLHDALPISDGMLYVTDGPANQAIKIDPDKLRIVARWEVGRGPAHIFMTQDQRFIDRKSTRLNSSHSQISYAVFCLKKKKEKNKLI